MSFIRKDKMSREKDILINHEELQRKYNILNSAVKYGQQLAKIGSWIYELKTGQFFWSEGVYNILGCGSNCLSNKLESFLEYVHKDDLDTVKKIKNNISIAKEYDVEYRIVTADKQVKYVHEKTKAILDEKNNPIKMAGIIQDITEQKLREISLMEIEEDFSRAQRVSRVGSWKYDALKEKSYATDEVYNILGINRSEFNNDYNNAIKLIHQEDQYRVQKEMNKLLVGQSVDTEFRIIQKSGTQKYVRSIAEPIFNKEGRVAGIIGTIQDITEIRLMHENLQKRDKSLTEAESLARIGSWEIDLVNKDLVFCSDEIFNIFGVSKEQLESIDKKLFINYIHPDDRAMIQDIYRNPPSNQPFNLEFRVIRPDGSILYTYSVMKMLLDKEGTPTYLRGITYDITDKKELQMEAELKQDKINKMQIRFKALVKESDEVFEILDSDGTIVYISEASEKVTGYNVEERQGKKIYDFYNKEEAHKVKEMMNCVLTDDKKKIKRDIKFKKKDGKEIYLEVCIQNFLQDPAIEGIVVNFRDITERVEAEKRIVRLSSYDQLTGLPNRVYFNKKIEQLFKNAKENKTGFTLLMLDIDSLEYIKNTLGYKVVEKYIVEIAIKLKFYCNSVKFICHYSNNRFIIILDGIHTMDKYEAFINGIYESVSKPLSIDKYELDVNISIGISLFNEDEDPEQLIRHAETAVFLAKNTGKNKYKFYSSNLDIQSYKQFILRNDIRTAIENNQLEFNLQPIVALRTNEILGAEVLLRWRHPEWGVVSPLDFITIAEETGYIIKIGNWLLREVCKIYKGWINNGMTNIKISINFSRVQFHETNFAENIIDTINEFGLNPHFFIMEITDSILTENIDKVINDIKKLQSFGIQVALDNFGTGNAFLSNLFLLNIDILKIDGSFIKEINKNENSTIVAGYIIKMVHDLKVKAVAEHIETVEQLYFLKDINCYAGQGYLFSKPVPLDDFSGILAKKKIIPATAEEVVVQEERRKYFRIKFYQFLEADFSILEIKGRKVNVGSSKALILNIGPGGLCFISNIRLPIDESIILQFKTQLVRENIIVYGCTVWTQEMENNLYKYGVKFTFDENKRSDLIRVLNQVQVRMKNDLLFADGRFISRAVSPLAFFHMKEV